MPTAAAEPVITGAAARPPLRAGPRTASGRQQVARHAIRVDPALPHEALEHGQRHRRHRPGRDAGRRAPAFHGRADQLEQRVDLLPPLSGARSHGPPGCPPRTARTPPGAPWWDRGCRCVPATRSARPPGPRPPSACRILATAARRRFTSSTSAQGTAPARCQVGVQRPYRVARRLGDLLDGSTGVPIARECPCGSVQKRLPGPGLGLPAAPAPGAASRPSRAGPAPGSARGSASIG
jgi:hypothetical protein